MRNEDTPAMPSGIKDDADNIGQQPASAGFTKREVVVLEFAKELTAHYSKTYELLSRHYDEIMREARTMADWYFEIMEE